MKYLKYILAYFFLISFQYAIGQKTEVIDSLWNVYTTSKNDSLKLKAGNYLAFHYIFKNPTRSDSILSQSTAYAIDNQLNFNLVELTNTRGIYFDVLSQKDSSKVYFEKALKLSREYEYPTIEVMCINNLGMFNWNNGNFKEAINYFYEALDFSLIHNSNNEEGRAIYFNNIGLIYQELSQYEEAITQHEKSLKIRLKYDRTKDIAQSYNNLTICYKNLGDLDKAEEFIRLGIDYAQLAEQPKLYHQYHESLGNILNETGMYKEAEEAYLIALNVPEEFKESNTRNEFIAYSNLIDLYNDTAQFDKAKSIIKKAKTLIDKDSTLFNFSESFYINSAKTYYATKEIEVANMYFEKYTLVKDSLFSLENANALAEVETKLKTKEKEAELAQTKTQLLEKELKVKQQNLLIYGSISAIIILIIIGYLIIRAKQLKNRQLKKETELQQALAKIELKNKLEEQRIRISKDLHDNIGSQLTFVISGLQFIEYQKDITIDSIKSKVQSIGEFTQQTIHELRDTIWAMNKEEIQLSELISRFSNFINRLSISENISVNTSKRAEQNSEDITFSALEGIQVYRIIQEAVNNAIKYANAENIKINFDYDNSLKIEIKDDGKGFDLENVKKGNGIKNMKSRAKRLNAKIEIHSIIDKGTFIKLSVPKLSS